MYKCVKGFSLEKCDGNGFTIDGEYLTIEDGSIWVIPEEKDYRFIGGEIRLETNEGDWIEITKETLEENFELIEVMKDSITDIQQARAIIEKVGEPYQKEVINMLRSLTYHEKTMRHEKNAQKIIENMEHEYALNTANILWKDKYDEIPQYIKDYS